MAFAALAGSGGASRSYEMIVRQIFQNAGATVAVDGDNGRSEWM